MSADFTALQDLAAPTLSPTLGCLVQAKRHSFPWIHPALSHLGAICSCDSFLCLNATSKSHSYFSDLALKSLYFEASLQIGRDLCPHLSSNCMLSILFFRGCTACGISVPRPEIKPVPAEVEAQSLNYCMHKSRKFLSGVLSDVGTLAEE